MRVDSGIYEGFDVPIYYDPLVAKLLVWAPTREDAIVRMRRALSEYVIRGIKTSIPFHILVMGHEKFIEGDYDTTFIDKVLKRIEYKKHYHDVAAISSVLSRILSSQRVKPAQHKGAETANPWKMSGRKAMFNRG